MTGVQTCALPIYDLRTNTLYAGLFGYLKKFAEERGYEVEVNFSDPITKLNEEDVKSYVEKHLRLPFSPYDYQYQAVTHALRNKRCLLLSPTASGKSLIIYMLIRHYMNIVKGGRLLLIVPTTSLVEQMHSDFLQYSQVDDSFGENLMHRIYSGKEKDTMAPIVITTWQSIYKLPKEWFADFRMVIGDEAHTFQAKSLTTIMEKLSQCPYRFGLTGTLDGTLTHRLVLEGVFGPVYQVTTTKALMDSDKLAKLDIKCLVMKYSDEECKHVKDKSYAEEIDFIIAHQKRNNFVKNLAVDQTGNTLVLFNRVDKHGKPLFKMIREKAGDDRKVFYVSGETDVTDRETIRAITEKEQNAIIVASLGTFSTGINIKNLHNIIFASPSKSQIKVLQSIGRGLRKSESKDIATLYDIADDLTWKTRKNYTLLHFVERMKIYNEEKFDYKIINVDMNIPPI